jgi:hypothetical protein
MQRSSSSFTKGISSRTSANTFTSHSLSSRKSSNTFIKSTLRFASSVSWSGINMTSGSFGFDEINSGTPFGIGEFGGIKHFDAMKDRK